MCVIIERRLMTHRNLHPSFGRPSATSASGVSPQRTHQRHTEMDMRQSPPPATGSGSPSKIVAFLMLLRRFTHAAFAIAGLRPAPKRPSLPLTCRAQCRVRDSLASFGQTVRLLSDIGSQGRRYPSPTARGPLHSDHDTLEEPGSLRPILTRALSAPNIHLIRERPSIPLTFPSGDRAVQSVRSSIQR